MLYQFTVTDRSGKKVPLQKWKGKVLLIVNTATKCGLTPQYEQLQRLYEDYQDRGFVILDFPCNQFLEQAPGSDEEIQEFCTANYHTTFPRFSKVEVNGPNTCPLYQYLKKEQPYDTQNDSSSAFYQKLEELQQSFGGSEIKWNFTKFLVDRKGRVVYRFAPNITPADLKKQIEALL